jgi:hypothetical protein
LTAAMRRPHMPVGARNARGDGAAELAGNGFGRRPQRVGARTQLQRARRRWGEQGLGAGGLKGAAAVALPALPKYGGGRDGVQGRWGRSGGRGLFSKKDICFLI